MTIRYNFYLPYIIKKPHQCYFPQDLQTISIYFPIFLHAIKEKNQDQLTRLEFL